ncbi:conserved hypothetical protein [Nostocoides japonicum T1-X7]|uniref:Mycothiol-dependent maleylpyruvate isomerase metal-binding domain-containing protein n=1 Tax=Nostocoides japonicum T1-X7 TaxID=1194083 RepID=A0A077M7F9_9MICO|nr:maleylpyruvate isomerase family mycothiol-dependent enzyme [Tetrasphaera japonica]CCH79990.1 conserved hypothetical protein [Tetrasphaera japonica T1-X7]
MPFHPAAPSDLSGLVDAYGAVVRAIIDLGRSMRPDDFDRPTDCPGWTVKNVISHVVALEAWLGGEPLPAVEVPAYEHIRNDVGRFTELGVEHRRGWTGEEVVDELEQVLALRQSQLYAVELTADSVIDGPFGPAPADTVLALRMVDIWTHEQDVREAIGRPGDLDTAAASVTMERLELGMPKVVARSAGVAPGNTVIIDVTGPVVGRIGVRVEEHEGRPRGVPLFTGEASTHPAAEGSESVTQLAMSTSAFGRLAAGRRSPDEVHVTVHGDDEVAHRVLAAMSVTM